MPNQDPEVTHTTQERKREIVRLRRQRMSFDDIGAQFGISRQRAHKIYWDVMRAIPAQEVHELRAEQREIFEDLIDRVYEIADRNHLHVSHGKVVRIGVPIINDDGEAMIAEEAGEPVYDDMPKLAAIREIHSIVDSLAALMGTRVPVKQLVESDTTVKYVIEGPGLENLT